MKQDIISYIQPCAACAIAKQPNRKLGLYLPFPIPDKPWQSVSMDFMLGLPTTRQGHGCVYVVVERFSKMAIMVACRKMITAEETVKLFLNMFGFILGHPKALFLIGIADSSANFGPHYGIKWTQS